MSKRRIVPLVLPPVNPVWRPGWGEALRYLYQGGQFNDRPNRKVVVYLRVSGGGQRNPDNFAWQRHLIKQFAEHRGFKIIAVFDTIVCGRYFDDRIELERAIAFARKHDAILLAATRDRLVRARGYNGTNESDVPAIDQYAQLLRLADGVPLATVLPPDNSPAIVRSAQSYYGQLAASNKGGRPTKKRPCKPSEMTARRQKLLPVARELRHEGWSYSEIAEELDLPRGTVQDWISKYCPGPKGNRREG